MGILEKSLADLNVDNTQIHENMQVTPLYKEGKPYKREYLILDEAINQQVAKVVEVSESGSVPELKFQNDSSSPILLLDGEELIGAKQNRIVNLTIMVGPERTIIIPVSCVESGRWQDQSSEFKTSERTLYSKVRAQKARHVTDSLKTAGHRRSNQDEVWNHINEKMHNMDSHSHTSAMGKMFDDNKSSLDDYVNAFSFEQNQCGAVFSIDGKIKGLELFDNQESYQLLMKKLLRSYALDAIEARQQMELELKKPDPVMTSEQEVSLFLKNLETVDVKQFPGTDLGDDLRLDAPEISGGGLYYQDKLIHLCVFPIDEAGHKPQQPGFSHLTRASGRGRTFH